MEARARHCNLPLDCYCIGSVHRALAQNRGKIGRAINIFERTVNIRTAQDELLVVTLDSTKSPVNLNVSAGPASRTGFSGLVREGQDALISADCTGTKPLAVFEVGGISVSIDEPDVFQNSLNEPVAGFLHAFAAQVDRIFYALVAEAGKRAGCLLNPDMTTEGLLETFFDRLKARRSLDDQKTIVGALGGLCGRGPGFTPAGDDFMAGYLAVSNWLSRALKLGSPIIPGREFSRLTTWTSFKLIEYSARGFLDDQAQLMVNSAASGDIAEYVQCIGLVSSRGHTSGIDFATGATIGLCAVAEMVSGTRTLDRVSDAFDRKRVQLS